MGRKRVSRHEWALRIHMVTGLIAAAWLLLIALTGILINHQEVLKLWEIDVKDSYLPGGYRTDVRDGATPLNVILTDIHSGRIFGLTGILLWDVIAVLLIVSITTGAFGYGAKRKMTGTGHDDNGNELENPPRTIH
ncbi:MAG: hypothetical protein A3F68_05555 [Acidobacteria bacterium RIFCSPLOWO2_12_FULL_54_10]|nr:MAG: hypothetical protein A3F68_05555 [Acidobacteria bacterium RIFCSPLOWO2_12_FULL_54_10]